MSSHRLEFSFKLPIEIPERERAAKKKTMEYHGFSQENMIN